MTTMITREESRKMIIDSELSLKIWGSPYGSAVTEVPWTKLAIIYTYYPHTLELLIERFPPDEEDLQQLEEELDWHEKQIRYDRSRETELVKQQSIPMLRALLTSRAEIKRLQNKARRFGKRLDPLSPDDWDSDQ